MAIDNANKEGQDAVICKYLKEPNNGDPVIRIVDYKLNDIIPRQHGQYTSIKIKRYI